MKKALNNLSPQQLKELMALNPALADEVAQAAGTSNPSTEQAADLLRKLNLSDIMSGLAASGKNVKDMASYKFWQTQPVPRFGEDEKTAKEGPLRIQTVEEISKEPAGLVPGFEWVTMDLKSEEEIKEVYELLNGHYVEDDDSTFRFNYSPSILRWYVVCAMHVFLQILTSIQGNDGAGLGQEVPRRCSRLAVSQARGLHLRRPCPRPCA